MTVRIIMLRRCTVYSRHTVWYMTWDSWNAAPHVLGKQIISIDILENSGDTVLYKKSGQTQSNRCITFPIMQLHGISHWPSKPPLNAQVPSRVLAPRQIFCQTRAELTPDDIVVFQAWGSNGRARVFQRSVSSCLRCWLGANTYLFRVRTV